MVPDSRPYIPWYYAFAGKYSGILETYSYDTIVHTKSEPSTSTVKLQTQQGVDTMSLVIDIYKLHFDNHFQGTWNPCGRSSNFAFSIKGADTFLAWDVVCGAGALTTKSFYGKKVH